MAFDKNGNWCYPLTIVADRYGGTYTGGKWLAFACNYNEIDRRVNGDDLDEQEGFRQTYGKGNTPEEAVADLKKEMANQAWWLLNYLGMDATEIIPLEMRRSCGNS